MLGRSFIYALLSAVIPRGLRPSMPLPRQDVPGVRLPRRRRGSDGRFKLLIAALRAMPTYATRAEKNAAKRARRALRSR